MPVARRVIRPPGVPPVDTDIVLEVQTTTASESFAVVCGDDGVFDGVIDWGDGSPTVSITSFNDPDLVHVYADAGIRDVRISGTFPNISYNRDANAAKILNVKNLGDTGLINLYGGFAGGSELIDVKTGNTSQVANLVGLFEDCIRLKSVELFSLGTASSLRRAFYNCQELDVFPAFDISNITVLWEAFFQCSLLPNMPMMDSSKVTNWRLAFRNCLSFTAFPAWDFSAATDMYGAFYQSSSLASFPPNSFDTCLCTNFEFAFAACALDQQSVDGILVSIDTAGQSGGILSLQGGTNATPGSAGQTAKTNLQGKGWTVVTN